MPCGQLLVWRLPLPFSEDGRYDLQFDSVSAPRRWVLRMHPAHRRPTLRPAQELWWETFGESLSADGAMWRGPPPPACALGPSAVPGEMCHLP